MITVALSQSQVEWVEWALMGLSFEWECSEDLVSSSGLSWEAAGGAIKIEGMTLLIPEGSFLKDKAICFILNHLEEIAPEVVKGWEIPELIQRYGWNTARLLGHVQLMAVQHAAEKIRQALGGIR